MKTPKTYNKFLAEILDEKIADKYDTKGDEISVEWETGGVSGGSCWESSNPQPYSCSDPEPEFELLDKLIEYFFPNIGFIQYKRACQELIEHDEKTDYEWYGNHTDYAIKKVNLKKLHEKFLEWQELSSL